MDDLVSRGHPRESRPLDQRDLTYVHHSSHIFSSLKLRMLGSESSTIPYLRSTAVRAQKSRQKERLMVSKAHSETIPLIQTLTDALRESSSITYGV